MEKQVNNFRRKIHFVLGLLFLAITVQTFAQDATYVKDFIGDRDRYEAFQLTQDDLCYYGFGYQEKNGTLTDSFSYDLTVAPIP